MLLSLAAAPSPAAAAPWKVGFMAVSWSLEDVRQRMDAAVWYPTLSSRGRSAIALSQRSFRAVRNAAPAPGPFPLLLISHPTSGDRFTVHDTAQALAEAGFVVAALTHPGDNINHMPDVLTWTQFDGRCRDMRRLTDLVLTHEKLGPSIDHARVGALGYDAGATTALLLGGALPDCSGLDAWCGDSAADRDPYCNKWARHRIAADLCSRLPLTKSLADTRVKAVAAVSPVFPMLMTIPGLRHFHPALLLVSTAGGGDGSRKDESLPRRFPITPEHYHSPAPGVSALTAPCQGSLDDELSDMCLSVDSRTRQELHEAFMPVLIRFFTNNLVLGTPRIIPDPPDLTPPPRPEETAPPADEKKQSRGRRQRR